MATIEPSRALLRLAVERAAARSTGWNEVHEWAKNLDRVSGSVITD